MNIENVGNGTFSGNGKSKEEDKSKSKRGRKPKADKQEYRYMIRLNKVDNERFLLLFRRSGMKSMSRFMADCVLNNPVKIVTVDKSVLDYVILLSGFFEQFRAIKTNYNQVFHALIRNFGEQKACLMMKIVEEPTREFALSKLEIERLTAQLKERCLPR
ncbi:hypothetical protein EZS27_007562 [termite gut metagenome]|uniref:MobA protein n=1 Tax=termite gut metagenome TaxID=433724 RepID=A0A5J4SFP9_9ZZZZ